MYHATGPIRRPKKNGTRQPHEAICSGDSLPVSNTPKPAASSVVSPWLATCQLAKKPRRPGTCSARKAVALPNSPPAEKPCIKRATTRITGAAMPML